MPKIEMYRIPALASATPKGPWDVVGDLAKAMGSAAPYVIVAAGVAFAFYEFRKLEAEQQTRLKQGQLAAQKQYQDEIETANTALRTTYASIQSMHSEQIISIKSLLELSTAVNKEIDTLRATAQEESKHQAEERKETEKAIAEADSARETVTVLQEQMHRISAEAVSIQGDRLLAQAELTQIQERLQDARMASTASAGQIDELRNESLELARSVIRVVSESESELRDSAKVLLERYDTSDDSLNERLRAFAEAPADNSLDLQRTLVGTDESKLEVALRSDLGFSVVARGEEEVYDRDDATTTVYAAVVEQADNVCRHVVRFSVREGIVDRVTISSEIVMVRAPYLKDWMSDGLYKATDGPSSSMASFAPDHWKFTEEIVGLDDNVEIIFGSARDLDTVEFDNFEVLFPELYETTTTRNSFLGEVVQRIELSKDIGRNLMADTRFTGPGSREHFEEFFIKLLTSAVDRNTPTLGELSITGLNDEARIKNRLATDALSIEFSVDRVEFLEASESILDYLKQIVEISDDATQVSVPGAKYYAIAKVTHRNTRHDPQLTTACIAVNVGGDVPMFQLYAYVPFIGLQPALMR